MRTSHALVAAIALAVGAVHANAQNGTVEYRIRELTGQTVAGPNDPVLDFTIEGRVIGVANRGLGDWGFNIRLFGEPEGVANGMLARLRISELEGAYFTGVPTTSTTGGGVVGMARHFRYLVGLNPVFNGEINLSVATFRNGADQEIGLITGSARGANLESTGIVTNDGAGIFAPATGAAFTAALTGWFGANAAWVELYRFRYTIADFTPRSINVTLERSIANTFSALAASGGDWAADTTTGGAQVSTSYLQVEVGDRNNSCAVLPAEYAFSGLGFTVSGDSAFATTDGVAAVPGGVGGCAPVEPLPAPVSVSDVWYRFTPAESSTYTVSLCSTAVPWNTTLSVHSACPNQIASNAIACNDDADCAPGLSRITNLQLAAGVHYYIRVARSGSASGGAPFVLDVAGPRGGACCQASGVCTISNQLDCVNNWTDGGVRVPNPCPIAIDLLIAGAGRGTITSQSPAATCPGSCILMVAAGTSIELAAQPRSDSTFAGWTGLGTGTGLCRFSAAIAGNAVANFRCRAEFDDVPGVGTSDIFAFLNAWFAGDPAADFNGMNMVDVADIFRYLDAWYRACRD